MERQRSKICVGYVQYKCVCICTLARFCIFLVTFISTLLPVSPQGRLSQWLIQTAEWELSLFNLPERNPGWNRRSVFPSATGQFTPLFHSFTLSAKGIKINRALKLQKFARRCQLCYGSDPWTVSRSAALLCSRVQLLHLKQRMLPIRMSAWAWLKGSKDNFPLPYSLIA